MRRRQHLMGECSRVILSSVGTAPPLSHTFLSDTLNIFFALGCVTLYFTRERAGWRSVLLHGAVTITSLLLIFTVLAAAPPASAFNRHPSAGFSCFCSCLGMHARAACGVIAARLYRWSIHTLECGDTDGRVAGGISHGACEAEGVEGCGM
jgi:hypothetical protein